MMCCVMPKRNSCVLSYKKLMYCVMTKRDLIYCAMTNMDLMFKERDVLYHDKTDLMYYFILKGT